MIVHCKKLGVGEERDWIREWSGNSDTGADGRFGFSFPLLNCSRMGMIRPSLSRFTSFLTLRKPLRKKTKVARKTCSPYNEDGVGKVMGGAGVGKQTVPGFVNKAVWGHGHSCSFKSCLWLLSRCSSGVSICDTDQTV